MRKPHIKYLKQYVLKHVLFNMKLPKKKLNIQSDKCVFLLTLFPIENGTQSIVEPKRLKDSTWEGSKNVSRDP